MALNRIIGKWIEARPLREVIEECEKAGVTIGPVYNMEDIARGYTAAEITALRQEGAL